MGDASNKNTKDSWLPVVPRPPRTLSRRVAAVAALVLLPPAATLGYVLLSGGDDGDARSGAEEDAVRAGAPDRDRLLAVVGAVSGSLAVAVLVLFLRREILEPLRAMTAEVEGIVGGRLQRGVTPRGRGEVALLTGAINRLLARLRDAQEVAARGAVSYEHKQEELRQAQEALVRSDRLASLGKLVAGVAHEINNPLGSVLTYCYVLLRKVGPDDPLASRLAIMRDEIARCSRIVHQLLDFARDARGDRRPTDINQLLRRTLELIEDHAIFHDVRIRLDLAEDLPLLDIDSSQIEQVIVNIAVNAAEACPNGGALTIRSRIDGRWVEMSFADTGVGISRDHLPRIFEQFFSTKTGKGTGLGLAVCDGIIKRHGGTIRVESEVWRGTTFRVRLPIDGRS